MTSFEMIALRSCAVDNLRDMHQQARHIIREYLLAEGYLHKYGEGYYVTDWFLEEKKKDEGELVG